MRKVFLISFSLLIVFGAFAQITKSNTTIHVLTKEDYLKKSKTQKTVGWVLLSGGTGLVIIGGAISSNQVEDDPIGEAITVNAGDVIAGIGALAMLSSIPFFVAASNNKLKGVSLSLKNEMTPKIQNSSLVYQPLPSLTLKIQL